MRTNIVIDDTLMSDAMKASGLKTKREAVEAGLALLVRLKRQAGLRKLRGIGWRGDLEAMRLDMDLAQWFEGQAPDGRCRAE